MIGPCKGILEYMKQFHFEAPKWWEGYRPAEAGGH